MKTLCLDFDGTLSAGTSAWRSAGEISDPPAPGAIDFLCAAVRRFDVSIFSSRSSQTGGIAAMRQWLVNNKLPEKVLTKINFPTDKPAAWVTIDDRAMQFTGSFPSLDEIDSFRPWTQLVSIDTITPGAPDHVRLPIEVVLSLLSRSCLKPETYLRTLSVAAGSLILSMSRTRKEVANTTDIFTYGLEDNVAAALTKPHLTKHLSD